MASPNQALIPNTLLNNPIATLQLTQIDNFQPVNNFKDSNGVEWQLVKSAFNSSVEIPDPTTLQITDYWNHAFPNLKESVYISVVEGVKQARND